MYIVDDICYAGNPCDNPCVIEAKPLVGGMMLLHFSTGELKLFDTTTLEGSAFDILADPEVFNAPRVEHGFVSWADGTVVLRQNTCMNMVLPTIKMMTSC